MSRVPPLVMHGCGHRSRSWKAMPLCVGCRRKQPAPQGESLREFRQRIKGSGR